MFSIGEAVVCVDASGLTPPWQPLTCGATYVIRDIQATNNGDTYKKSKYMVWLWGITNPINKKAAELLGINPSPNAPNQELAYSADRFEKINPDEVSVKKTEKVGGKV
jgi:hypothetical protein